MKERAVAFMTAAPMGRCCSQARNIARMTLYVAAGITIPMILNNKQIFAPIVRSAKGMTKKIQLTPNEASTLHCLDVFHSWGFSYYSFA